MIVFVLNAIVSYSRRVSEGKSVFICFLERSCRCHSDRHHLKNHFIALIGFIC